MPESFISWLPWAILVLTPLAYAAALVLLLRVRPSASLEEAGRALANAMGWGWSGGGRHRRHGATSRRRRLGGERFAETSDGRTTDSRHADQA